jgi:hypothetical protein
MNRMEVTALCTKVIPTTKLTSQFFATIEEACAWATAPFWVSATSSGNYLSSSAGLAKEG